jgi:hypothetical protein
MSQGTYPNFLSFCYFHLKLKVESIKELGGAKYYPIGVCILLEKVVQVIERFMFTSKSLWQMTGLLFKRNLHVPHVCPVLTTHGKIF